MKKINTLSDQAMTFLLNDTFITDSQRSGQVLVDVIRDQQKLKGTTVACREGDCGACCVLVGDYKCDGDIRYRNIISCLSPTINMHGKHVVTIEGIIYKSDHFIQQAFCIEGASQCGFCTPGFIVSLTCGLINEYPTLDAQKVISYLDGNVCRCTGYKSIERAIKRICIDLAEKADKNTSNSSFSFLIEQGILPTYFSNIKKELAKINLPLCVQPNLDSRQLVGGGTDLFVQIPDKLYESQCLPISCKGSEKKIQIFSDHIWIYADTTIEEFKKSSELAVYIPNLDKLFDLFASLPIRNIATIGGNLVNASPIGDLTNLLLTMRCICVLEGEKGRRDIALIDFYLAYKKVDLKPSEWLMGLRIPLPSSQAKFNFEKISKRRYLDIASVNSSIQLTVQNDHIIDAQLSAGGVAAIPLLLKKTSNGLINQPLKEETLIGAINCAQREISPITDIRGTSTYKRQALSHLIVAHFLELYPDKFDAQHIANTLKQLAASEVYSGL